MNGPPERVQAVVIGGGVVGCAVLRELAERGIEAVLVEAEPSLGEGTSKANSAIVHTGFDAHRGTLEAAMLRRAAALWPDVLADLGVPFLDVGALMIARDAEEAERLRADVQVAAAGLGVHTELLDRAELQRRAPYVTDTAAAALAVPGEGIIDPFWLTRAYAEAALGAGAQVWTSARVTALDVDGDGVIVGLADGRRLRADQAFNAAGLWADEVAALAGETTFVVTPRKGQFLVSEEAAGVDRIVLPLPGPKGKGMLVTPIVFGGLLLGPTAEDGRDKDDRSTDGVGRARVLAACTALVPVVATLTPIRQFAGLRAVPSGGDYLLRPSICGDRLYHVAGIRSTGISTSPAVAERTVSEAAARRHWEIARRAPAARPEMSLAADPGELVCPCRWVSAGEVAANAEAALAARTLDAVKRACGATFGDCQGNRCAVATAAVLAAAQGLAVTDIVKHRSGSWLFAAGPTPPRRPPAPATRPPQVESSEWDVAIVGGGLAGIGAAIGAVSAGLRPLVVERRPRWGGALGSMRDALHDAEQAALRRYEGALGEGTIVGWRGATVVGLAHGEAGWSLDVQAGGGAATVHAGAVILAVGGYVEPREHLAVAGPRGSGIATGDLVDAALDVGLVPGHHALLVGTGRYADALARRMEGAGLRVHRAAAPPDEVRGAARLEAVHTGAGWLPVDLLVLAERHVPAPFLLRQLGLVDHRVGTPAPADAAGRCGPAGLWAAGTCRVPDVDHRASLADGARVGQALEVRVGR